MQLILLFLALRAGAITIPNFTPGAYDLQEGKVDSCGDGPVEYLDGKTYVSLSAFHNLPLENKSVPFTNVVPEEKGCVYQATSSRENAGATSTLNFKEVKTCGPQKTEYHTLTKTAVITKDRITLDVAQKGNATYGDLEPSYGFRCIWKLRAAAKAP